MKATIEVRSTALPPSPRTALLPAALLLCAALLWVAPGPATAADATGAQAAGAGTSAGATEATPAGAVQLQVAVAANFRTTLQKLAVEFGRASGDTLLISAGSSGQLYTQIQQGAPFDVFLSADTERPQLLEKSGLTVPGSRFTYAVGTLVLWSPREGFVDAGGTVLKPYRYHHIAIANPRTAPYGAAAEQVLQGMDLWSTLNQKKQVVIGENITQAWQFVASGNAELGFVALSQVLGPDGRIVGSYWLPPQSLYAPIDQDAVILAHSAHRAAAQTFTHWLRTAPAALSVIHAAGYHTLDE